MPTKQSFSNGKIKALCTYALLTAVCLIFGYIESLFPLFFIAPGVKVGLANAVALILAVRGDYKGALLTNTARILLSTLLFSNAASLMFSLPAGILSVITIILFSKLKIFSPIGLSILGGIVHNVTQCFVGVAVTGRGVLYYLPLLIVSGIICGAVTGTVSSLILKKLKTNT